MKYFICKDKNKFKKHEYDQYGHWFWYADDQVKIYQAEDYIVLYCGYLIEGDIVDACERLSFHEENGNFFAVKLTPEGDFELFLDYFNNHKIFVSRKYGTEISNWLPFMTCHEDDIAREGLVYDMLQREFGKEESITLFDHIHNFLPPYDYMGDCKRAYEEDKWNEKELTDYIHECMSQHAEKIKSLYSKRFISLSEGIDSALQSQYFKDDPQYGYTMDPCDAGEKGLIWKQRQWDKFKDVSVFKFEVSKVKEYMDKYFFDSTTRWASILPTMIQVAEAKPDIVMYGVNGDEMFFRDLTPHLHAICLHSIPKCDTIEQLKQLIRDDVKSKETMYGADYSIGDDHCPWDYVDIYFDYWLRGMPKWRDKLFIENEMYRQMTPKYYTRAISVNNDVMSGSLFNDRRIYHEVFKMNSDYLREEAMDSPIQRELLNRFGFEFETPCKDVLYADYDGMHENIFSSTVPHCLEQNI